MATRLRPRMPHLGHAPLGIVGLMFHFTVQPTATCCSVAVVVSHSKSTQQQMNWCCRGLIVLAWFADDDLEPEKC